MVLINLTLNNNNKSIDNNNYSGSCVLMSVYLFIYSLQIQTFVGVSTFTIYHSYYLNFLRKRVALSKNNKI